MKLADLDKLTILVEKANTARLVVENKNNNKVDVIYPQGKDQAPIWYAKSLFEQPLVAENLPEDEAKLAKIWADKEKRITSLDTWIQDSQSNGNIKPLQDMLKTNHVKNLAILSNYNPVFAYCMLRQLDLTGIMLFNIEFKDLETESINAGLNNLQKMSAEQFANYLANKIKEG